MGHTVVKVFYRFALNCRKADEIASTLRQNLKKYSGIDVYTREEIPEELHWAHNEYCPPILILAKVTNLKANEIKEGCVNCI